MVRPHQVNINLLERVDRVQDRFIYGGLGLLLAAVLWGWSGYYFVAHSQELNRIEQDNNTLKYQISSIASDNIVLASVQADETERLVDRQAVETLESHNVSYAELIYEIDRAIPTTTTMVGVETVGSRVILTGFSPDHYQVARLMEGLKKIPGINHVAVFLSAMNENTNEVKYSVELNWEAEKR
ncbi:MAG: hypothetical protein NTV45_06335 [Firmicutes bacterium]|nr:hypothetical protein [Bacillota bacterium]